MAGYAAVAQREIYEARKVMRSSSDREKEIFVLKEEVDDLKDSYEARIEKLKGGMRQVVDERDATKLKLKDYKEEVKWLRDELKAKKSEDQILAEFWELDAYDQELATVAARKIQRYLIVAEKLCSIDPGAANWDTFVKAYMDVEDGLVRGEGEPTPYVAPSSSLPPKA